MEELEYRVSRIESLQKQLEGVRVHKLMFAIRLPPFYLARFKLSVLNYVAAALKIPAVDEVNLMEFVNNGNFSRDNVTPNGGIVPKNEYQIEYNLVLKYWGEIFDYFNKTNEIFSRVRIFPSIRLKEGSCDEENVVRPFRTELPHSDSWVDGYWGLNIHMPIFGDLKGNRLEYFYLKDETSFSNKMLGYAKSFEEMQWVLKKCESLGNMAAPPDHLCVSDYLLIHRTKRTEAAKSRISLDSCCVIGKHDYKDDDKEFVKKIPRFGVDKIYLTEIKSGTVVEKKSSAQGFSNLGAVIKNLEY